ncbi:MAG: aminotransferase class I/II-fold pyridoxal phosphate-dependent enzyme [Muribaculaceae bacterium]|nr:aminotransferase class I/II-fold pyridoxal phosphate-dependent enzyme [Muribaculaceae bacterium]
MTEPMNQPKKIVPADRVEAIKEYYFSRKLRELARLNAEGADIISLGIGGPDRAPSAEVIATMQREVGIESNHSYQSHNGLPELRRAFADWYQRKYGVTLNPDNEIQPLIGSKEGILHLSLTFLNPGDGVLVPDPGYPTYSSVSRLVGAEIFTYDLTEEGGWLPDFDALERLPLDKIKLMWVNYPHMPTGRQATRDTFERLIDFGRRHGIVIAHDNPYSFILNREPQSILQVEGAMDVAIELNSLSKSHNMAGWRVAMAASNPTFISWLLKVKSNIDSGQFKPVMLAATEALKADDSWYDQLYDVYAERRTIAEDIMRELGCSFDEQQRGMFLWGRIPDDVESGEWLADELFYKAKVFITPGFIFGRNGERYVRISLCAKPEKLRESLNRIRQYNNNK